MKQRPHKKWKIKTPCLNKSLELAAELDVSPLVGQLLVSRGITDPTEAYLYLNPDFKKLYDPFRLSHMEKAVERIKKAVNYGEKICIYGDYDADGTTATALLLNTFCQMGVPQKQVEYYIPNRFTHGYGLSQKTVENIREKSVKLLITVDCGITSILEIEWAKKEGIDVIVTDHHQPNPDALPCAHALLAPKIPEDEYPYEELAGVGLAFKLAQGLAQELMIEGKDDFLRAQLDLVALGTVVDMAPLTEENRMLTRLGLQRLNDPNKKKRLGLDALCQVAGYENKPLGGHALSFGLGPRINAAGRMDTADNAVKLLTTDCRDAATRIASELNEANQMRQELERQIQDHALEIIENETDDDTKGIVVASEEWNEKAQGVVGIVASRLVEKFHKPAFVIAINGDEATGSGRCIDGMNLADSLVSCSELLMKHGGHAAAAGLTLKTKNISKFKQVFNEYTRECLKGKAQQPKLVLDFETPLPVLTLDTLRELEKFEPFGRKNHPPRLAASRVTVNGKPTLLGKEGKHLSMDVSQGGRNKRTIAWRAGDELITFNRLNMLLDIAFSPEINKWKDRPAVVQLILDDWKIHSERREVKWDVFPILSEESSVKLVDRRNTQKKNYLLKLLAREESCIIYVQDKEMLDYLLTRLLPESIEGIAAHDETTSREEEAALLKQLESRELRTIASSSSLSSREAFPFVKHVVFCHLTPSPDLFFKRCAPAFATEETSYLHLIYGDTDGTEMRNWVTKKYPEKAELQQLYGGIRKVIQANGAEGYAEAAILNGTLGAPATVETGLTIFEELEFIERYAESGHRLVKLRPAQKSDLSRSPTYLRGEWIKQTSPSFIEFQLKENIESMWERVENECQIANKPDSSL